MLVVHYVQRTHAYAVRGPFSGILPLMLLSMYC